MTGRPIGSSTGIVTLDCGHVRMFRPSPPVAGETVYCGDCGDYRGVSATQRQIKVKCRNCVYSRSLGVGGESDLTTRDAEMSASKHAMRYPGHVVALTDSDGEVTLISTNGEGQLPMEGMTEQRVAENRPHQSSLKGLVDRSRSAVEPRSI